MPSKTCEQCGTAFEAKTSRARFCGSGCRARKAEGVKPAAGRRRVKPWDRRILLAVSRQLADAGRGSTALGLMAVDLARTLGDPDLSGSARATVARELRATLTEALEGARRKDNPVDALKQRRDAKFAAAG